MTCEWNPCPLIVEHGLQSLKTGRVALLLLCWSVFLNSVEEITHGTHRYHNQRTWRERGTGQARSRSPFPTRQRKFCGGGFRQGCTACSGPEGGARGRECEQGGGLARRT